LPHIWHWVARAQGVTATIARNPVPPSTKGRQAMTHEHMRDAAYAANIPTPWHGAVAGYLNSRPNGDPLHPWSLSDWGIFKDNRKLPIFVQSAPVTATAEADAFAALEALYDIGVPIGVRTALDIETAINPHYVNAYGDVLRHFGYYVWVYGSASTLFGNPPLDGYWVADYLDGKPFEYNHPDVHATQYTDNPPKDKYDSSAVKLWTYDNVKHWWR
jgi:hypothetical protein